MALAKRKSAARSTGSRSRGDHQALASSSSSLATNRIRRPRQDETRVASRGKRDVFAILPAVMRMPNPDPTLLQFGNRGFGTFGVHGSPIYLYTRIIQQFPFVGGYCASWVDHVLATDRVIKAAKASNESDQLIADAAAARAARAWGRVKNRVIVMQKLLMGRFYGFSRAEKVWRFDPVIREWIQDLYDVPWEAWLFDDQGRDYMRTVVAPFGNQVDSSRFIHLQWGSADTKYGAGVLSEVYLALWFIQQIQEFGLQALEDYSKLIAVVHVPRSFTKSDREKSLASVADQYRYYVTVPTDESKLSVETPALTVTANGTAGRQEYEVIRFYERWIQIRMLGAPQTQDKGGAGNGKLDEIRSGIWEDKTPLGSSALDQVLTEQWLDQYFDVNQPELALELRPRFESDSSTQGLDGRQAQQVIDVGVKLAANQLTVTYAVEVLTGIGIPRPRAQAMCDSIVKERNELAAVVPAASASPAPASDPAVPPADGEGSSDLVAIATEDGHTLHFHRSAMVLTDKGEIPASMLHLASGAAIVTWKTQRAA